MIFNLFRRIIKNILDNVKRPPTLVLMYHRVTKLSNDPQLLAVTPENFYNQIVWLKNNFHIYSVEELEESFDRNLNNKGGVVVTFDDGYADNYLEALPILEKLKVPALFFISTSNIDTDKEFWWDDLERIFLSGYKLPRELFINNICFKTDSKNNCAKVYNFLQPYLKYMKVSERNKTLNKIIKWSNLHETGRATHRVLSSKEINKMSKSKYATLGVHTSYHSPLSIYSFSEQLKDIDNSKNIIEKIIGKKVKYFSYPFGGARDYNEDSIKVCHKLKFNSVFVNKTGKMNSFNGNLFIPRYIVRNWRINHFKMMINLFTWLQ